MQAEESFNQHDWDHKKIVEKCPGSVKHSLCPTDLVLAVGDCHRILAIIILNLNDYDYIQNLQFNEIELSKNFRTSAKFKLTSKFA